MGRWPAEVAAPLSGLLLTAREAGVKDVHLMLSVPFHRRNLLLKSGRNYREKSADHYATSFCYDRRYFRACKEIGDNVV